MTAAAVETTPATLLEDLTGLFASEKPPTRAAVRKVLHEHEWAQPGERTDDKLVQEYGWVRPEHMVTVGDLAGLSGYTKSMVQARLRRPPLDGQEKPRSFQTMGGHLYIVWEALPYIAEPRRRGRKPGRQGSPLHDAALTLAESMRS
jgi:hypothetical protein